jgi:hypothetical protein
MGMDESWLWMVKKSFNDGELQECYFYDGSSSKRFVCG